MKYVCGRLAILGILASFQACSIHVEAIRTPGEATNLVASGDTTPPNAATSPAWVESTPQTVMAVTASWTKSGSADLSNQKIQFYSDSSCTTASGSEINLASSTAETYAWTAPGDGTFTFKVSSFDAAGNSSASACSPSMVIDPCLGIDALVPFASGDGTSGTPYAICSKEQMNRVGSNAAYLDKYFILLKNIDLASYTANSFTLIGTSATPFVGTFNGNGKVISNLTYSAAGTDFIGLFRKIGTNGVVKNLGVEGASITGGSYTGIIAGETVGSIENSHSQGTVVGATRVGGLSGRFWETNASSIIKDSYFTGSVSGSEFIGGLIGWVRGTVKTSYATGTVNATANRTGGLIGVVDQGSVQDCYTNTTVVAGGYGVGGLVGAIGGNISGSHAKGSVSGTDWVGGIVGWNGAAGAFAGFIKTSYSENTITARDSVGGITGYAYATGPISDCYSRSSISARQWVGGLVGSNAGTLTNSYFASSTLTASTGNLGGLQGSGTGAVTASFWDVSTSGVAVSGHDAIVDGVGGETTTTMKTATTYTTPGWSATLWNMVDGSYPTLK